jgi:hypothetical protein
MQVVPVEIHWFHYLMLFSISIVALHDCNYFSTNIYEEKNKKTEIYCFLYHKKSKYIYFFFKSTKKKIYKVSTFFGTLSFQQHASVIFKQLLHTIDKLNLVNYCAIIFFCWNSTLKLTNGYFFPINNYVTVITIN